MKTRWMLTLLQAFIVLCLIAGTWAAGSLLLLGFVALLVSANEPPRMLLFALFGIASDLFVSVCAWQMLLALFRLCGRMKSPAHGLPRISGELRRAARYVGWCALGVFTALAVIAGMIGLADAQLNNLLAIFSPALVLIQLALLLQLMTLEVHRRLPEIHQPALPRLPILILTGLCAPLLLASLAVLILSETTDRSGMLALIGFTLVLLPIPGCCLRRWKEHGCRGLLSIVRLGALVLGCCAVLWLISLGYTFVNLLFPALLLGMPLSIGLTATILRRQEVRP